MFYEGGTSLKIWPVGTERLLGVREGENPIFPKGEFPEHIKCVGYPVRIFADYLGLVCPFTEDRPGEMRYICVQRAENIRLEQDCARAEEPVMYFQGQWDLSDERLNEGETN